MDKPNDSDQFPSDEIFIDLVLRHFDGVNNAEESKQLEDDLNSDEKCRSSFILIALQCRRIVEKLGKDKLEQEIARGETGSLPEVLAEELSISEEVQRGEGAISPAESAVKNSGADFKGLAGSRGRSRRPRTTTSRSRHTRLLDKWKLWGGIAACFLVLGLAYELWPTDSMPEGKPFWPSGRVASIEEVKDAKWDSAVYKPGMALDEFTVLRLVSGEAQLSMISGAELVLHGPCEVCLASSDRVQLKNGRLTASIADWAHGFTVETNRLEFIDLGTKFSVQHNMGETKLLVLEGSVAALTPSGSLKKLVKAGYEAISDNEHAIKIKLSESTPAYANLANVQPFRTIRSCSTGQGIRVGRRDPYWSISLGPRGTERFVDKQPAIVVKPRSSARYIVNDPSVSQWIGTKRYWNCEADSTYTFSTSIQLDDVDPSAVTLVAHLIADNRIEQIRVNGVPVLAEFLREDDFEQQFLEFQTVEIKDCFVEGDNLLEVDVFNGQERRQSLPNPMLFRAELLVYGRSEL